MLLDAVLAECVTTSEYKRPPFISVVWFLAHFASVIISPYQIISFAFLLLKSKWLLSLTLDLLFFDKLGYLLHLAPDLRDKFFEFV